MCSAWDIEIIRGALSESEVKGRRVLEVGSRDINGSVRSHIEAWQPAAYVGLDLYPGSGVDVVCDAADIDRRFGEYTFDIVVSTELLEHVRDWKRIVHNFKHVLKPNGILLVTTRSFMVDFHAHPFDFWRYERDDFASIFSDLIIERLELDTTDPGLFLKARKPEGFVERDLSEHALYSILRQRRRRGATDTDILLFKIRYRLIRLLMDLLPKKYRRAVH